MNLLDNKAFIIIGLIIAVFIGVLAVFFASGDPDGLESTALMVQGDKTLTGPSPEDGYPEAIGTGASVYLSPFPDYSLGEGAGPLGGVVATVLGIIITLGLVLGITRIMAQRKV